MRAKVQKTNFGKKLQPMNKDEIGAVFLLFLFVFVLWWHTRKVPIWISSTWRTQVPIKFRTVMATEKKQQQQWSRAWEQITSLSHRVTTVNIFVFAVSLGFMWVAKSHDFFFFPTSQVRKAVIWRFPLFLLFSLSLHSPPIINASPRWNVLSWGVWQWQEQKDSVYLGAVRHSVYAQTADSPS